MAPQLGPKIAGSTMSKILTLAIDGYTKLPGAKKAAISALNSKESHEAAISKLVTDHIAMAGAQGFTTNLGGFITALATIPANIIGVLVIQCRLVAAIAHLRGYDLTDNRVKSAILMTLLGDKKVKKLIKYGKVPSTPLAVATAPAFDPDLDDTISTLVLNEVLTAVTGKRFGVFVSKKIPILGGGVGAIVDSYSTHSVSQFAKNQFPSRHLS